MHLDLSQDQVPKGREIAILKLLYMLRDRKIPALKGFIRDLQFCQNITFVSSSAFSSRFMEKRRK
jgi:hypothetical protein